MELFDLEIPIRSTGGDKVKADFKSLETAATATANKVEPAMARTATATAQVTGSVGQAADALRKMGVPADQVSATLRRMGFTAREVAAELNRVPVAATQTAAAMSSAAAAVGTAGRTASTAAPLLNRARNVLAAMTATAIGASGALGTLGGAMLAFTGGGGIALGVVAGIGAVVLAYRALTARSREQKKVTDDLRESFRQLNNEMNKGAQAGRAAEQKTANDLRRRIATLETRLAEARARPVSADPEEQQARRVVLQRLEADIAKARQDLRASQAELDTFDANQAVENAERRRDALITLVSAGKASAQQEQELRAEIDKTRASLASITPQYAATAHGIAEQAMLTERLAAMEAAFTRETKAGNAVREDRTAILLALLQLETPTAERWVELRTRADAITASLAAGNVPLAERVELLRELASIEAATGFAGDLPPDRLPVPGRTPLRQIEPPAQESVGIDTSAFEGDSISAVLLRQFVEAGMTIDQAMAELQAKLAQGGASLAATFQQGLVGAFEALGSGGGLGAALAQFTGSMLSAIGTMAIEFGLAAIGIGALMEKIMASLASLNPIVAIAAGAALVALGSALKGAASKSFGGGAGRGGNAPAPITRTFRVSSSALAQPSGSPVSAGVSAPAPKMLSPVNVTYYGGKDPGFQRWLIGQVQGAQARGL